MLILEAVELNSAGSLIKVRLAEIEEKYFSGNEMIPKHKATLRTFDANVALNALRNGSKVEGLKIENGMLGAGNGAFTRYRRINNNSMNPIVIVARVSINNVNSGFCILGADGAVGNWSEEKTVLAAKKFGIANGKVVTDESGEHISSIIGEYRIKNINKPTENIVKPEVKSAPVPEVTTSDTKVTGAPPVVIPNNKEIVTTPSIIANAANDEDEQKKAEERDLVIARSMVDTIDFRYSRRVDRGMELDRVGDEAKGPDGLSPREKIAIATLNMKRMNMFIYTIFAGLDRAPVKDGGCIRTAAVSPFTMTLYYNTSFINSLTCGQVLFTCIHETYHVLMKHGMRQGKRIQTVWNKAADYFINKTIAEQFDMVNIWPGEKLIEKCEFTSNPEWKPSAKEGFKRIEGMDFILWDKTVDTDKDSAETIYYRIMKQETEDLKEQLKAMGGLGDQNDKDNQQNSSSQSSQSNKDDSEDNEQQSSSQSGDEKSDENSGSNKDEQSNQENGQNKDNDNANGEGENSEENDGSDGEGEGSDSSSEDFDSDDETEGVGLEGSDSENSGHGSKGGSGSSSGDDSDDSDDGNSDGGDSGDSGNDNGNKEGNSGKSKPAPGSIEEAKEAEQEYKDVVEKANKEIMKKIREAIEDIVNDTNKDQMDSDDIKDADERLKAAVANAVTATRMCGHELDKAARRIVQSILEPKIDFRAILRNKLNLASDYNMTWKRPGRRGDIAPGIAAPGRIKGDEQGIKAVFAIDTSGSVGERELKRALGFVVALCKQMKVELEVIFWNTYVSNRFEINDLKDIVKIKDLGTGGTDVTCVFEYIKGKVDVDGYKYRDRTEVLLVATDGCFDANYGMYRTAAKNVIWLMQDRNSFDMFNPLFGIKAPIDFESEEH